MELQAKLIDIVRDIRSGEFRITLAVKEIPSGVDKLPEGPLAVTLKRWSNKRSLSANAYYWMLVAKIAKLLPASESEVHNILLGRYGQPAEVDGELVTMLIPDTPEAEEKIRQSDTYHLRQTSHIRTGKNGKQYRAWRMMRGSSTYDTAEMAQLIDGTVAEAKHMGIETLPDEEIERMLSTYEVNHSVRR